MRRADLIAGLASLFLPFPFFFHRFSFIPPFPRLPPTQPMNPTQTFRPTPAATVAPQPAELTLAQAQDIEVFLNHVLTVQRTATQVSAAHRKAIAHADLLAVSKAVAAQEIIARELLGLEERRDRLLVSLGVPLRARAGVGVGGQPIGLRAYVARCPQSKRSRLEQLLDETAKLVRANASLVKGIEGASRALVTHITSLMSHIKRALTQTGVYSPGRGHGGDGAFAPALAAIAMDVKG